jgi:hypothetical protein
MNMRTTKGQFDRLCGRDSNRTRLIEQGDTPIPLFEIDEAETVNVPHPRHPVDQSSGSTDK